MKKAIVVLAAMGTVILLSAVLRTGAQERSAAVTPAHQWEYAWVKWDGPDRMQFIYPNKFEFVHMAQQGYQLPKEAQEEQYYLCMAANKMAKEGWEPIDLDSRRILFRRAVR